MRERASGQEGLKNPTPAATRIATVLEAVSDSPLRRFTSLRRARPKPMLQYPHPDRPATVISLGRTWSPFSSVGLKVDGDRVYKNPADIEALLDQNGTPDWKTQTQRDEALILHYLIRNREAQGDLSRRKTAKVEKTLFGAHLGVAQTVAEVNGGERVYFPYVAPQTNPTEPHGTKMIEVITGRTKDQMNQKSLTDKEIRDTVRSIVDIPSVRQVLDNISDHAVTIERIPIAGFERTEFIRITDAKGNTHIVHELLSEKVTTELRNGKKIMVVFGPTGDNAKRFSEGWNQEPNLLVAAVGRGRSQGRLKRIGNITIEEDLQFDRERADDTLRLDALLRSGLVTVAYSSTSPDIHLEDFKRVRPYLKNGALERWVTTKPVAVSLDQYMEFKHLLAEPDDEGNPLEYKADVHEHYLAKAAWESFITHLNEVITILGKRLQSVTAYIEEAQTIEKPTDRSKTLHDGMMRDLLPHLLAMLIDIQEEINHEGRYTIGNRSSEIGITTVRYEPTKIDPGADTGFDITAQTTIVDNQDPERSEHILSYKLVAGKGAVDKKEVHLSFEGPQGEEPTIIVDLQNNSIRVINAPTWLEELLNSNIPTETSLRDTGYRKDTASALISANPGKKLQSWRKAFIARKWEEWFRRYAQKNGTQPISYPLSKDTENRHPIEELTGSSERRGRERVLVGVS